ncbi:hypothetical protein [Vibrio sp. J502]|uniref:hypothetical protein n=1 Tax=Vibrio sp. J502 TaxID=2978741 RepID=UPI0021BF6786|nr:hypothetical protein [Vibrio sp. J502]UXH28338.1 hypothetical protein N5E84_15645 [Vibrio sp. J502]
MESVDYSQDRFEQIRQDYVEFSKHLQGDTDIQIIPLSALEGGQRGRSKSTYALVSRPITAGAA